MAGKDPSPSDTKWYLVVSPDGDWGFKPVEATDPLAAVTASEDEPDSTEHVTNPNPSEWDVYELVSAEPTRLKAAVRPVPR